jgi:putative flippase GtrA
MSAMTVASGSDWVRTKLLAVRRARTLGVKAISFGLIGVVNTIVDYCVFLLARAVLSHVAMAVTVFGMLAGLCNCGGGDSILLVAANLMSWTVSVSSSYVLNSSFTFAAESQRKLRWRAYFAFVIAGIVGLIANTTALVVAAEVFLLPVWAAKGCAVLASFVVNFSISNFIVFRVRHQVTEELEGLP